MNLFDKMKKYQPPEKPNDGEFKSDVSTILHGTSVQNRKEMCELEYMKARRLLKNPTVTCNADTQRQFFNQYVAEKVLQCRYCKLCNFFYQVQKPLNTVFFYKARLFFCRFFRLFGFLSLFFCFFLLLFLFGFCRHELKLYKSDIHSAPKLLFI